MNIIQQAKAVLDLQIRGIQDLSITLDNNFATIVKIIANCNGHIILSGVGKSGNIGMKIVATMSSIGIPSFFLDPFNAGHGDMGMITKNDVMICLSNSGESSEIMSIVNYAKENGNVTISITRDAKSTIATNSDFTIVIPKSEEAHEFMAPTTSTTQMLTIGDTLAVCASKIKNFTKIQYAKFHPSGSLGMKISKITNIVNHKLFNVENIAGTIEVLGVMSKNSNGFVCVIKNNTLYGIITDGDIRRFILKNNGDIKSAKAEDICNKSPKFLNEDSYIIDAINVMQENRISSIIIVDSNAKPVGFISRNQFNV